MRKISLCLDEVLEDSPQTRCLLNLFEEDASKVGAYMLSLQSALKRLVNAQTEITAAVSELGSVLNSYKNQTLVLEHSEIEFPTVVDKFQSTVNELSSWMEIVSQQLKDCTLYPVNKFIHEINELNGRKDVFHAIADELDNSILKHAKLNRKDSSKKLEEVNEELCAVRRRFHLAGLHYYVQLNNLQFSRRIALLEPILSLIYAFRSFCHVGHQALANDKDLVDFFTRTQEQLQSLHSDQEKESNKYEELLKTVNEIERLNPEIYNVEADVKGSGENSALNQKQGYLFLKSKSALLSKWDRLYCFTQSGNLMAQTRDELAGKLILELNPGVKASIADNEDRRNTFFIDCPHSKRHLIFQAQNSKERDEWVDIINKLSTENLESETAKIDNKGGADLGRDEGLKSGDQQNSSFIAAPPIQFDLLAPEEQPDRPNIQNDNENGQHTWPAKFLGNVEVSADRGERVAQDAIRQILSTRSAHNIVKSVDVKLSVRNFTLFLLEPENEESCKAWFCLEDLALWTADPTDKNIIALIVRTKGGKADGRHKFSTYVFDALDAKIVDEIFQHLTESTKLAFQSLMDKKEQENTIARGEKILSAGEKATSSENAENSTVANTS